MGLANVKNFEREFMKNVGKYVLARFPSKRAGEVAEISEFAYMNIGFSQNRPTYKIKFKDNEVILVPASEDLLKMAGYVILAN